jgi:dienelactone hydrolase
MAAKHGTRRSVAEQCTNAAGWVASPAMQIRGTTTSTPIRLLLAAVAALALVAGACSDDDSTTSGGGTSGDGATATTTVAAVDDAAYADTGPYVVGTTSLDLDGRIVEVWYPADPGAEAGATRAVFEIRDLLPEALQSIVPDELNPTYETAAYVDIAASEEGPFPLVIFAHGFGAYPTEYQFMLTHLASWGFVVAGPDFNERGLVSAFASAGTTTTSLDEAAAEAALQERVTNEAAIMTGTRELLAAANTEPGGLLEGRVDATNVGVGGQSAGVTSALAAANADPNVKTFIAMSGGRALTEGSPLPPPDMPGMVMTGGRDEVAEVERVRELFDSLNPPKRLVVIEEAGHNSFSDLCVIGADQGGVVAIAKEVGIPVPENLERLFNDGCVGDFLPTTDAWPAVNHFTTAHYRAELGVDPEPVGLGPGVSTAFGPATITYTVDE